jgi:hypothetical protein
MNRAAKALAAVTGLLCAAFGAADDREDYNRRAARADMAAFGDLDLNRDGRLTWEEVRHDLNFGPRFADVDINRDGVITGEEMRRYIEQTYQVTLEPPLERPR